MSNALSHETSPYLRQHADNPVDWHPWGEHALALARESGKPILLSVGYSACHWCHVMAHESFEDEATAALMNELFVNIKVDREERPDLDKIYQIAHQMLTQRGGGWPLTMFLAHDDRRPFFGGTYFPKDARYGMPAFSQILTRVAQYYADHQADLREQSAALMDAFAQMDAPVGSQQGALDDQPLIAARKQLASTFDRAFGGFGKAPKFPHATSIDRLLRDWHATAGAHEPDLHALFMATLTLTRMGEGGLFDQLGGGFCRYSVDEWWMIPHFEKMLYDNGSLLASYANAALATGELLFARVASRTAEWVLRDMQAPEGGFYSSLDADSEHHEGKFYVWDREEVGSLLDADEVEVFARRFGLEREPNFEGKWHLHVFVTVPDIAAESGRSVAAVTALLASAGEKLLAVRNRRVWPGRDEKILTSWNALMIRGLAIAARTLQRPDFADAATRALDFLEANLWRDGRLLATCKDGHAHLNAYLDDYVLLADAIIELNQFRWRTQEMAWARTLLDATLEHFEDRENGGFFFTSDDHEALIHRSKSYSDDATPAGNGIAAFVLQRAGHLWGDTRYLHAAERTLRAAYPAMLKYPQAHTSLLTALEETLHPPGIVILRGDSAEMTHWLQTLHRSYEPRRLVFAIPASAQDLPAVLDGKRAPAAGATLAYRCRGSVCSAPIETLAALLDHATGDPIA